MPLTLPGQRPITRGQLYDALHPLSDPHYVSFIDALCGGPTALLELGCGTGRLSLPLAARGHRVTGVDIDTEMLCHATEKSGRVSNLEFLNGDYRLIRLGREFRCVLFSNNTLVLTPDVLGRLDAVR